jgi:hypothetical protein
MKQLLRATAVAIGVGAGIVSFAGVAHAWDESANAQSACVGGVASITVTFTNGEPSTGDHAMVVSATDDQSDENAIWGNGESEVTVAGGETVTGTINTHMENVNDGSVRISERWATGSADHDVVVVSYESRDCTPPAPAVVPQTQPPAAPVSQPTVLGTTATTPSAPAAVPTAATPKATAPTAQVAAATLPNTGRPVVPLTVAGFGVLGLGLVALGATNTRAARLRRFAVARARVCTGR